MKHEGNAILDLAIECLAKTASITGLPVEILLVIAPIRGNQDVVHDNLLPVCCPLLGELRRVLLAVEIMEAHSKAYTMSKSPGVRDVLDTDIFLRLRVMSK